MTVTVRPATAEEADAVGLLTERVYRDGGFLDDDEAYVAHLLDGAGRVRDALPERDWDVDGFPLIAYRLDLG